MQNRAAAIPRHPRCCGSNLVPVLDPHVQTWVGELRGDTGHALGAAESRLAGWRQVQTEASLKARLQKWCLHRAELAELQAGTRLEPQHVLATRHDTGYLHAWRHPLDIGLAHCLLKEGWHVQAALNAVAGARGCTSW